ncbi:extracellular solute-binding protein [Paenibacillus sp. NPDC058174]|uniref:extracellular solute-binding protein n=1 Tax=Paenibacillus sp. NPDC058174 TaxID=3346366 RepID=UPI0036DD64A8
MKKSIPALLIASLLVAMLAGCASKNNGNANPSASPGTNGESSEGVITLDLYSDRSWYSDWTGAGAKRITAKTGISFNVKKPVQDDGDGKDISLMIASNSLPDLMVVDKENKMLNQLIDGGYLYSMDELIDKYAPNLRKILDEQYGEELLTNFKEKDGKTYKLISGYQTKKYLEEAKANGGLAPVWLPQFVVRKDYYDEIGRPDTSTPEKFLDALQQMAKNHPDKIPYLGDKGQHSKDLGWFLPQFGIEDYYVNGDKVQHKLHNPQYKEMIKFANAMASKGLLTKESFVNTGEVTAQKVAAGSVIVSAQNSAAKNNAAPKDNPNTSFEMLSPFSTYMYPTIPKGWMALVIPKSNKNPERTIKLLEYAASKEGQADFFFGVEGAGKDDFKSLESGPHFYYDQSVPNNYFPQGKPSFTTGFNDELSKDWSGSWKQAGMGEPIMLVANWAVSNTVFWNPQDPDKLAYDKLMSPKMKFFPEFNFTIDSTSEVGVIEAKINTLRADYLTKLVFAKSETELDSLYSEMMSVADSIGIVKLENEYTKQYANNKAKLANQ